MNAGPIIPAIRAEALANKFAAASNFEHLAVLEQFQNEPRLVELLWFIQWQSMQPGGLNKFCAEFVEQFADRFAPAKKSGHYSEDECRSMWSVTPARCRRAVFGELDRSFRDIVERDADVRARERLVKEFTPAVLQQRRKEVAAEDLPRYLAAVCNESDATIKDRWYCKNLISALFEAMDEHAARIQSGLAETTVAEKVFDGLDYAYSEKGLVAIEGESRFGKTAALETWCGMRSGKARLVQVPDSNSEIELYKEVARALGIEVGQTAVASQLRDKIDFVLRSSKLMLVLDEAHYLYPQRFSKTTPPARLNWVRSAIVDRRLPAALCFTPQSYKHARNQYLKATAYAMQQFEGRFLMRVVLPETLTKRDLLNVAQHHFPEFEPELLEVIVAKAIQSQGYLQTIKAISQRARYLAEKHKRNSPSLTDLETAISEVQPGIVVAPSQRAAASERKKVSRDTPRAIAPAEPVLTRAITPKEMAA